MIQSVTYTSTPPMITITLVDGSIWYDDASLPADTHMRRRLGEWLEAGGIITPYAGTALVLADLRTAAKAAVDAAAEAYRLTFITGGSGQAMAYTQKLEEAKAYLADTGLTAVECPHIFAEVGLTGQTAWEVAQVVVNLHAIWQIKSADIERKRLAAKAAIDAAETAEGISAAADVDWYA